MALKRIRREMLAFIKGYNHLWWKSSPQEFPERSPKSLEWLCIEFIGKNLALTNYSVNKVTPDLAFDIRYAEHFPLITANFSEDRHKLAATMYAPIGSVYEGGTFHLVCDLPQDYPFKAPKFTFITKIYHPNVSIHGSMCCCSCGGWPEHSPSLQIKNYLKVIWLMMKDPAWFRTHMCVLEPVIGEQVKSNYATFAITAQEWTKNYAI